MSNLLHDEVQYRFRGGNAAIDGRWQLWLTSKRIFDGRDAKVTTHPNVISIPISVAVSIRLHAKSAVVNIIVDDIAITVIEVEIVVVDAVVVVDVIDVVVVVVVVGAIKCHRLVVHWRQEPKVRIVVIVVVVVEVLVAKLV